MACNLQLLMTQPWPELESKPQISQISGWISTSVINKWLNQLTELVKNGEKFESKGFLEDEESI